ncbi:hypothetical protein DOY81_012729 [Sarcophaga bullata]|nr:hypothetical protein DOY81_012729 [Sarcophaga bullata]
MSDDELSNDMQELNELIAEYRTKEIEEQQKENDTGEESNPNKNKEDDNPNESENVIIKSMEVPMDKILFGDKTKLIKNLEKAVSKPRKHDTEVESDSEEKKDDDTKKAKKRKPVWDDADDEEIQLGEVKRETKRTGPLDHLRMDKSYKEYLTAKFTRIVNQPKWASLDETKAKDSDDEEDEELLRTVAALVAGDKGVATIYAIDGNQNDKLHNIHITNFPIRCARILPCGTKAVFGSITRLAYLYDLMSAKKPATD